jgi:hypothetical protein
MYSGNHSDGVGRGGSDEYESIIRELTENERIVLGEIATVFKTKSGFFHERAVARKRRCWEIDVPGVLKDLQKKGLAQQVNPAKHLWQVTRKYCVLEHAIKSEIDQQDNPWMRGGL